MIDTHAHVYQHVTGRFGLNADMVGVRLRRHDGGGPGRPELHDHPRVSPLHRRTRREPACCASSPPIWSAAWRAICTRAVWPGAGGREGHHPRRREPTPTSCAASRRMPRSAAPRAGGWRSSSSASASPASSAFRLYIHLGQLWPVKDGATIDPDEVVRALHADHGTGRRAGPSVHPASRRLRLGRDRRGASRGVGGAGARRDGRCGPRLAFQFRNGPPKVLAAGIRPTTLGRRHARLQRARRRCRGRRGPRRQIRSSAWRRST